MKATEIEHYSSTYESAFLCSTDPINSQMNGSTDAPKTESICSRSTRGRRKIKFSLRPHGREAPEERFRLSMLDIVMPPQYNVYAIVFRGDGTDDMTTLEIFKHGIEETLKQCRHLVGRIEENDFGDYSIIKRHGSNVPFVVQWLDGPDDDYPSFFDLERAHFSCAKLGDPRVLSVEGMPKICLPNDKPAVAGFQLNFIPGGFIFTIHVHHFAVDMTGTGSIVEQIAQHCCSASNGTPKPIWDEVFMDRSRFTAPRTPVNEQIDPVPKPQRHPDWLPCSWLLFHLPRHKSAELKDMASPSEGSWISTYDAVIAVLWRIIARNRAKIYKPDLSLHAIFGEPVDVRSRCKFLRSSKSRIRTNIR